MRCKGINRSGAACTASGEAADATSFNQTVRRLQNVTLAVDELPLFSWNAPRLDPSSRPESPIRSPRVTAQFQLELPKEWQLGARTALGRPVVQPARLFRGLSHRLPDASCRPGISVSDRSAARMAGLGYRHSGAASASYARNRTVPT